MTETVRPAPTPNIDYSMRAKQLVASVRQGRRINIDVLDEGQFSGYLAGWDDDTYFLLCPEDDHGGRISSPIKLLIPKTHILFIQLVDARTFREEPLHEEMERIVKPFRDALNNQYPK